MSLFDVIHDLYPHAQVETDFSLIDDGSGPRIETWNTEKLGPQPTAAQLEAARPAAELAAAKTAKQAELIAAGTAAITGGYQSSALGTAHVYPSGLTDQINMLGSVAAAQLAGLPTNWTTGFTCVPLADAANADWPFVQHTAGQIQQAGADGKAWITAQRVQLKTRLGQVAAATTPTDVDAIQWTNASP